MIRIYIGYRGSYADHVLCADVATGGKHTQRPATQTCVLFVTVCRDRGVVA